jgi:hypothetical protein
MDVPAHTASEPSEALRQGLRERGYVEGQNIVVERRFGDGKPGKKRPAELFTSLSLLSVLI